MKEIEVALSFWCDKCQTRIFPETDRTLFDIPSMVDLVEQGTISKEEARETLQRAHFRQHQEEMCHV